VRKVHEATELYKKNGEPAGIRDVADWWINNYPSDIFIKEPKEVVKIRNAMLKLVFKLPQCSYKCDCQQCCYTGNRCKHPDTKSHTYCRQNILDDICPKGHTFEEGRTVK